MKTRRIWLSVILLAALCLTTGAVRAQEKSYGASSFDVELTVEEGGAVLVTETVVFDFVGGPFTFVFRELPTDHTDGISVLASSVDGVFYPIGENPGQVEISAGNPMRITWHLEPTSNASRTVVLTYRADGVVRQGESSDELQWQALPDNYEYFIGQSRTAVDYPEYTTLVSEPALLAGAASISQSDNQVSFNALNLQPNSPLVFRLQFEPGSLISAPPNWQTEQEVASAERDAVMAQRPYWIAFAFLIFGAGLVPMVAYYLRHRPHYRRNGPASVESTATVMEAPSGMAPAMAGSLAYDGAHANWNHAQGTMFSLAERGVLIFEELPEKKWYRSQEFAVKLVDHLPGLMPHEEAFLELLYVDKDERTMSIKLSDMAKKISGSSWKQYKEALRADMKQAGFLNESRKHVRKQFLRFGGILLVLALAVIVGTVLLGITLRSVGFFRPLALSAAVAALGITAIIFGSNLSILSDEATKTAELWRRFREYLKEVSKGKRAVDSPTMFEKNLPYAAGFGLLHQWAKHFEKEGWSETPPYFHVLPTTTGMANMVAFVAFTSTSSSSGGSVAGGAAGAAGAGVAGGGASGAG